MAESTSTSKRKTLGRSVSTESTDYSITMGRSVRDKKKKPKERWLLTRKTWRYMADAGRKLIPDGAQNRLEDVPKIEAYFQEVCKKEHKFLLWRKNSYPGAIGFRKKRKDRRKGGSCRKSCSADDVDAIRLERPTHLPLASHTGSKFDIQKMKYDFLNKPPSPTNYIPTLSESSSEDKEEKQLLTMLEQYLKISDQDTPSTSASSKPDFDYQELIDRIQRHLTLTSRSIANVSSYQPQSQVHFTGDYVQKSVSETLSRYFSQHPCRDKVISDLLTDRKTLQRLYFDLRQARGFRRCVSNTDFSSPKLFGTNIYKFPTASSNYERLREKIHESVHPPPLIEIENETFEATSHRDLGIQTHSISEAILQDVEEKYKKMLAEKKEEEELELQPVSRRRSSVDNDDISQSVSDTIKRYLRMARKKSVDGDKADRFKRVNYDRNLRNIKAKGEITKPGDDDGLNKGCQTNDDWILKYRELKFDEIPSTFEIESRESSARSSIDAGVDENNKSSPSSPPPTKSHSFLSQLLHGKYDKQEKTHAVAAGTGQAMQKSKSSSSVMHHGSRLMAKKIFRSRSKSQTRPSHITSSWTPQGGCTWSNLTGRQVVLGATTLLQLTDVERKVLQKVALAKLQALNLGIAVKVPTDSVGAQTGKPKRRPYLLKRKAITTSIFDTNRKDGDKDSNSKSGGLVFGIPIMQCVENDRLSRAAAGTTPFRSTTEPSGLEEESSTMGRYGSRSSFSSLIEASRGDESGSCESLLLRERLVGSVPGLLDAISCGSIADLATAAHEEEAYVPNIVAACFRHILQHGLRTLGIFRVSTSKKRIRQLREDFDCGKETTLDDEQCPHDVATLLKEYLRDLPDPLLCRELYQAFVQTQRIRNRRLQFEALQHLVQLLPTPNRDTLYSLLGFLAIVAQNSADEQDESGESILGNKMDSNNLATVFAPNILHCIKAGNSKETIPDNPEDRIDVINVVRTLIDHYKELFCISAELLDEIYVHMMDTHPEELEQLLNKRDAASGADESVDEFDSESYSAPWSPTSPTAPASEITIENVQVELEPKKMYSREECLHETAATGGPNVGMRIRHKDRIKERSSRRKRDESTSRRKKEDESVGIGSGITSSIMSRLRGQKDDDYLYTKNRSSSMESTSSTHTDSDLKSAVRMSEDDRRKSSPYVLDNSGVIHASLTIPVQKQNPPFPLNLDDDIPYIEDSENGRQVSQPVGLVRTPSAPPRRRQRSISGSDSSVSSIVQPITGSIPLIQGYDSAVGSSATYSSPVQNTPSVSSSIADAGALSSPPSWASTPPTSPDNIQTVNYLPEELQMSKTKIQKNPSATSLQKVSFASTQEVQQVRMKPQTKDQDVLKSSGVNTFEQIKSPEREPKHTPSITSIGNAVLRSKTENFERITKVDVPKTKTNSEKKKYTKRRYTDSRHQTRHIPDSEALDAASSPSKKEEPAPSGLVYKRRELISSVPSK